MSGALSFGKNFAKNIVRQNAGKVKKIGIYSLFSSGNIKILKLDEAVYGIQSRPMEIFNFD